jgi:Tfp pilus assembly protein PilV
MRFIKKCEKKITECGFTLLEAVLSSSLLALLVTGIIGAFIYGNQSAVSSATRSKANLLAEEGLEAVRNIRDSAFANLIDGVYGLSFNGNQWNLVLGSEAIGIFTRLITISSIDSNTKLVTSQVTWNQSNQIAGNVNYTTELTNWMAETSPPEPTWANPGIDGRVNLSGSQDGLKVDFSGDYIFFLTEENNGEINAVNAQNTSTPVLSQTVGLAGSKPRNIDISGNYAYISTQSNNNELLVIDISIPENPTIASTLNLPGGADANGIYVVGERAYLTRKNSSEDEFFIINISTPNIPALISSLNIAATLNEVYTIDGYAYIASESNSQELLVVDITNEATPRLIGSFNLSGDQNAITITGQNDLLYVGQGGNLHIFDISVRNFPTLQSNFTVGGDINDLTYDPIHQYLFLGINHAIKAFLVLDVSGAVAQLVGQIENTQEVKGVIYVPEKNRVYSVGSNNNTEMFIFKPQP